MKLSIVAAATSAVIAPLASAGAASAQTYVSAAFGGNSSVDLSYNRSDGNGPTSGVSPSRTEADDGSHLGLALGRQFGSWRGEIAFNFDEWDSAESFLPTFGPTSGTGLIIQSVDAMGYFDFDSISQVTPYVGAGVGFASVKFDDGTVNDSDNSFHVLAAAGLSIPFSSSLTGFAEVRLQTATAPLMPIPPFAPPVIDSEVDVEATGFRAGLRWSF
jgi:opacity protein-like surface antigen